MTKANDPSISPITQFSTPASSPDITASKNDKKKKSLLPKIFGSKRTGRGSDDDAFIKSQEEPDQGLTLDLEKKIESRRKAFMEVSPFMRKSFSERETSPGIEGLNLSTFERSMGPETEIQSFRIFVATWNVGGKSPNYDLNLHDFLLVEGSADVYVLGFQEIVPLSAGNVLVIEDNEPAAKWLTLISQALNRPRNEYGDSYDSNPKNSRELKGSASLNFFQKSSLKVVSKSFRAEGSSLLKACNCPVESPTSRDRRRVRKFSSDPISKMDNGIRGETSMEELLSIAEIPMTSRNKYSLIASKQMVGIFLTVWTKKELVPHIGHLRVDTVGRGIMGCLGNKVRTTRIIWLGDLNYRVALSYEETRVLLEDNDWDTLLEKDQLNMEREAGRVFSGFREGRILFAPTYKYSQNSDSYAGETVKSKKKRRTPAWCDRILWRGKGIEQLSYIRGESRFSDHRPVCGVFSVDVEVRNRNNRFRKGYSYAHPRLEYEDVIPQRHSFYD
ncbi:hypothetical protein PIB30_019342 [Stylosanthes scabra]|uniref:Inositol polyphosphate-related phosphatase domain-containing protein n=1 Tax=Stylosanthes scabra TaxID=79078 RepID=A0ABU6W7S2_9FABA|nr:hypothetical protein [Stylosanthes scabra]